MFELPEHLSSLNALAPSPSAMTVMDTSAEDAVWNYLNTDELFRNFGVHPSDLHNKDEAKAEEKKASPPADLKSFIEQFANDESVSAPTPFLPVSYNTPASTPAGVNTADVMSRPLVEEDWSESPEDRVGGAKKLKQMGAGQVEIEEDKRRRNTEASARFRAKKKEREQNLERRAKELEAQVAQLAADKASLENENRLLKAIVLGGNGNGSLPSTESIAQLAGKRKRE